MKKLMLMFVVFVMGVTVAIASTTYPNDGDYVVGATKTSSGVFFKVWAPNANDVDVVGDFNTWTKDIDNLEKSENGYWSGLVAEAVVGSEYKFLLDINGLDVINLDPAGRDTHHSGNTSDNASIVVDATYNWAPFNSPNFNDYLIYQMQIGSFAGYGDGVDVGTNNIATFKDVEGKLDYIKSLGFTAIELLPIQEFAGDRSWGYNPALFYTIESAYGDPEDLRHFVNEAHKKGLAIIFDVVYNHAGPGDNILWEYDGAENIYFQGGWETPWGVGPAHWKSEVQDFFAENAKMYFSDYNADGLRFDATTKIDPESLKYITNEVRKVYSNKYLSSEHLGMSGDEKSVTEYGFNANWMAAAHHNFESIVRWGENPISNLRSFLAWDGYYEHTNVVKYLLGSHDDCGDQNNGEAEEGKHRYMVEHLGGRDNWLARAKVRMGWALNVTIPGTPMMFMGTEIHTPGYWHDGTDLWGDHRFNWEFANDWQGMEMRRLVKTANDLRVNNAAFRTGNVRETHADFNNNVYAFKRWDDNGNRVLVVVNMSDTNFTDHSYGVSTDYQWGQWQQALCTQDSTFGGWNGSGNAYYEPWTQSNGKVYINLPKWSVIVMKLK